MQGSFGAQPAYMSPPQINSNPFGMVHQQQPPVPVSMQNNPFAMQAAPQPAVMGMAANPYSQMNNQMSNMNLSSNPFAQQQQISQNNATVRLINC